MLSKDPVILNFSKIEEQGIVEQDVEEDNNSDGDDQDYGDGNSDEEMDDDYE